MTSLADLRYAAQLKADRVNSGTILPGDWNQWINGSAAALYRLLVQTYEDYQVSQYPFTLVGGVGGNTLSIGVGSGLPAFDKLRHISRVVTQAGAMPVTYAPVLRCDSLMQFDELSSATLFPIYAAFTAVKYMVLGATIEIRPAVQAGAQYLLYYIPSYQKLLEDEDTIDGTWMATNGIEEYIALDVAAKAMIKEESLDTANLLLQQREAIKAEILAQFAQRDDNMPGRILDVRRARDNYGIWGGGGRW